MAGDLISELDIVAHSKNRNRQAGIGGTLRAGRGESVTVSMRFRDPDTENANGENPRVARIDLIVGDVRGPVKERNADKNSTTKVVARFSERQWTKSGDVYAVSTTLPAFDRNMYLRVRGTSTNEEEPSMDAPGENPWSDLWFYSNPIFIEVHER